MTTFAQVETVLAEVFADQVANQINRACVLAQILDVRPARGKNIQWVAKVGTATPTTAVIADGADVSVYNRDDKLPAVLQYGTYHDAFSLTGKALAAARSAGNPMEIAMLLVDELGDSVERLARSIASGVYTGDGSTNTIHGLYASGNGAILDVGSYAGIDRATYTQWKGNVCDAGTSVDLSALQGSTGIREAFFNLRKLQRLIVTASGQKADLFITDPIQHERIGLAYQAERRYTDAVRRGDGTVIKLDGGYNVLEFDGYAIVEDPLHPASKVTALNTRECWLEQLPDSPDVMNMALGSVQLGGTPEHQMGAKKMGLRARIQPLAITGDAFKFALYCYPQLVVRSPNTCGYITDLLA